jgi:hypothetical protein
MRLLVDLRSHLSDPDPAPEIIQVQRTPAVGSREAVNGKYVLPIPLDLDFPITSSDYLLDGSGNIDGGDVVSKGYAHLLARFPQFGNIYFNPLLTSDHVAELVTETGGATAKEYFTDTSLTPAGVFYPRFQTGREEGVSDDGQMPTHTAMLPVNDTVTPNRPGLIITDEIDLSDYTLDCDGNPVGADQFMLYWKLYKFSVSHDVAADVGALAGTNEPALRQIEEIDQEPAGFSAYISTDGGANWCHVGLLEPLAFCDKTTKIILAFRNDTSEKLFLASFAVMF